MLVNLTPHVIIVRTANGDVNIPPSGTITRVSVSQEVVGDVDGITVVRSVFGTVEGLPEPVSGTTYIVSSMVAQAVPGRDDVVAPDTGPTAIRGEDGRIMAVTRFQKF